ncbi:MAG: glycosyltransferase family 39 protein [Planctomycetes bacterium]|nr:glycosyltransferase family 39 protein [Planctomycetota bacterium]
MIKPNMRLLAILIVAGMLRVFYAADLPLVGDEVGVGLLQASGQAVGYKNRLGLEAAPLAEITDFVSYSPQFGPLDVLKSLRHAGMHPPAYYLVLHYVLKYVGNDAFILRLGSILASLLSVVVMYRFGKEVCNESVGYYSALFLGISAYGVFYGSIVRPYPLIMLISLVSTFQAWKLSTAGGLHPANKKLILYAVVVLLGLYTIYHFLFVFAFQIAFLVMSNLRNKKALLTIGAVLSVVFVLYLPWLPSLSEQLKVVRGGTYYFHGEFTFASLAESVLSLSFLKYLPTQPRSVIKLLIAGSAYMLILAGSYCLLKVPKKRAIVMSLAIYVLCGWLADRLMHTETLAVEMLLFFLVPMSLFLLAAGMSLLPSRYHIRTLFLAACCAVMLINSIFVCRHKPVFSGPRYLNLFSDTISSSVRDRDKALVIINTTWRRHLFSFAHAVDSDVDIRSDVDIQIVLPSGGLSQAPDIADLESYDLVFIANCRSSGSLFSSFSPEDIGVISDYLSSHDFRMAFPAVAYEGDGSSLTVFRRGSDLL